MLGNQEMFRIEADAYDNCVLKTRGTTSTGAKALYTGATGQFEDKNGNAIHVVNGLVVEI